ncbi:hypothetical protein LAZ67_13001449 [Cordylochernes scorpioides]|uniref:CCHC-type domain-containing protein n=1 Tax=Cordylochernes scorpioides TaxID=51811 RepID=A0ABY6L8P6_9ARAC|nr:hypothetical protein LAZ67_13001449 [Cordylochernes scorpioides]
MVLLYSRQHSTQQQPPGPTNYHQEAAADSVVDSEVEITEAATTAGEEGHRKFECTKPARGGGRGRGQSRDGGSNNTCYNCGEVGHRKYECTNNTAEDGGQEENQRKSKKARYTCGEFGHKKDDCPKSGTQESGDEEESSDNEEEETPQKRKQAEDSEEEEVEAEEPPKKKSKKPKKKEEDCYLTLQAYRTMPLESARSREMRRPPLRHQPGSQGDARMTRSKRPRRIALHQRPHLQEMEGCRGTTKTRIQRRASLQCQPCIQDMEGQSRYLEDGILDFDMAMESFAENVVHSHHGLKVFLVSFSFFSLICLASSPVIMAMICVFWDCEGVLYWEMLERNATVNKDLYIAQLHRVNEAIQQKRPDRQGQIILLHDNARPHVATNRQSRPSRARMGSSTAPAVLSGPCTNRLPPFPLHVKPYERHYL